MDIEFKYASVDSIIKMLESRIEIVRTTEVSVTGYTGLRIGLDMVEIAGQATEEMMDMWMGMIYELPLQKSHAYLTSIANKLICAEVYETYFPTSDQSSDQYASVIRRQALNSFQSLFNGLGIFVSGADNVEALQVQNDENRQQTANKALILPGEILKPYIGYDYDGDGISDTDLFKKNANLESSELYTEGTFLRLQEMDDNPVLRGVRVRPRNYRAGREEISFY